jgi:tetratricopeptide (TPR) repeat protein
LRRVDRSEALLKAAAARLNDLPSAVDTAMRPPVVILDGTKSSDGNDVFAVIVPNPSTPTAPANVLTVPANNARFRGNDVKSGDIVKYYVVEDQTVDPDVRRSGFTRRTAIDLVIAQVLDDQTLLIEEGLHPEADVEVMLTAAIEQLGEQGEVVQVPAEQAFNKLFPQGVAAPMPQKIEVWRHVDDRLDEIDERMRTYRNRRLPPLGWEPSPDSKALTQIVVWLNQWLRQSSPKTEWQVDPLLKSLPPDLASEEILAAHISDAALGSDSFEPHEGRLLQEAVWHRDISRWARGDSFSNLERAAALFDWTVRNVQLQADSDTRPLRPWQVLLYGHGTAEQRAWVFTLLCRQLGLDVVVLGLPSANNANADQFAEKPSTQFWLPALSEGGQLYLFDTRLGLAIPGPGGEGIATLEQVQSDDSVLRQLDLANLPYPVTAEAAKNAVAYVVADPFALTRRARQVELQLTGDERLALSVDATALAEQLSALPQLSKVQLWEFPFRTLRDQLTLGPVAARNVEFLAFEPFAIRPLLWKARTRHFQGRRQITDEADTEAVDLTDDHAEAARLYTSSEVRPADRAIERETSPARRRVDLAAKLNATYWLGLLSFDEGRYDVAAHWISRPELRADTFRKAGADYNLARTYEAQGRFEEAAALLEGDTSPQRHGNRLRARRLRMQPANSPE